MNTMHMARGIASLGRNGDTELIHMSPDEIAALAQMGHLTINPETGLPEAFSLKGLLKGIASIGIPIAAGTFGGPWAAALASGLWEGIENKSVKEGMLGGLKAFMLGKAMEGAGAGLKAASGSKVVNSGVRAVGPDKIKMAALSMQDPSTWDKVSGAATGAFDALSDPKMVMAYTQAAPLEQAVLQERAAREYDANIRSQNDEYGRMIAEAWKRYRARFGANPWQSMYAYRRGMNNGGMVPGYAPGGLVIDPLYGKKDGVREDEERDPGALDEDEGAVAGGGGDVGRTPGLNVTPWTAMGAAPSWFTPGFMGEWEYFSQGQQGAAAPRQEDWTPGQNQVGVNPFTMRAQSPAEIAFADQIKGRYNASTLPIDYDQYGPFVPGVTQRPGDVPSQQGWINDPNMAAWEAEWQRRNALALTNANKWGEERAKFETGRRTEAERVAAERAAASQAAAAAEAAKLAIEKQKADAALLAAGKSTAPITNVTVNPGSTTSNLFNWVDPTQSATDPLGKFLDSGWTLDAQGKIQPPESYKTAMNFSDPASAQGFWEALTSSNPTLKAWQDRMNAEMAEQQRLQTANQQVVADYGGDYQKFADALNTRIGKPAGSSGSGYFTAGNGATMYFMGGGKEYTIPDELKSYVDKFSPNNDGSYVYRFVQPSPTAMNKFITANKLGEAPAPTTPPPVAPPPVAPPPVVPTPATPPPPASPSSTVPPGGIAALPAANTFAVAYGRLPATTYKDGAIPLSPAMSEAIFGSPTAKSEIDPREAELRYGNLLALGRPDLAAQFFSIMPESARQKVIADAFDPANASNWRTPKTLAMLDTQFGGAGTPPVAPSPVPAPAAPAPVPSAMIQMDTGSFDLGGLNALLGSLGYKPLENRGTAAKPNLVATDPRLEWGDGYSGYGNGLINLRNRLQELRVPGYAAGGMVGGDDEQAIQAVIQALQSMGEPWADAIIKQFIEVYGIEAFNAVREMAMQQQSPGAQTQGMVDGVEPGMSDSVPGYAHGGATQPIAVSPGEFIVPADVVSMLGDGNTKNGAAQLYDMMERVRQMKTGSRRQAPPINPRGVLPA